MPVERESENLVFFDDLSGFFNRRYLYSWLPKELKEIQDRKRQLWLLMLDIDNFKMINDTYGHLSGDQLIKEVSAILKENTKTDDKRVRYAGDEFTIIFSDAEINDVLNIAKRLVAKVDSHRFKEMHSGKEIHITISVGIAGCPKDAFGHTELINLADKALYISKQKGKNCVSTSSEITADFLWKKDFLDRFPCPVMAGRKNEVDQLNQAVRAAVSGQRRCVLVAGELGIGKSRLLNEFERLVAKEATLCLSARCAEKYINQPLYIIGNGLDGYFSGLHELPKDLLAGISDAERAALASFIPLFKELLAEPDTKKESQPYQEADLCSGLVKLLRSIAARTTVLFFFDDLQYADEKSIAVLEEILTADPGSPLLIAGSFSSRELTIPGIGESGLIKFLSSQKAKAVTTLIELEGLSKEEVKDMISSIFPNVSFAQDLTKIFYSKTKGNPLFVEELSKYCIEKELVYFKNGQWQKKEIPETMLPSSIEEVIKSRIEDLDDEVKQMIAKAAVIGKDFQVDFLREIDSEDRGYVLDVIEAAKKIGLIYGKGGEREGEFTFTSNGIRDVLFKSLDSGRVKQLYSRVGEIQEKHHSDKLSSVAGELYYTFKKAEDKARAEQYAQMIKDGRASLYDRTIKYAQTLLEEVAQEKKLLPLSKEMFGVAVGMIKSLYMAAVNFVLYPPSSKMRLLPLEEMRRKLASLFQETELVTIAVVESNIVINNKRVGKELPSFFARSLVEHFTNANLESMTFKKGVTAEELTVLLGLISSQETKEENVSDLLKDKQIDTIEVNEIVYNVSRRKSKEKDGIQEMMLVDFIMDKVSPSGKKVDLPAALNSQSQEIMRSLEQLGEQALVDPTKDKGEVKAEVMAKGIQQLGEQFINKEDDWVKGKEGLAKMLMAIEPQLRADILASQIGKEGQTQLKADIIKELSVDLPDEVIVDVLKRQYLQEDVTITKMQSLIKRFLPSEERKQSILPLLQQELLDVGATQEECEWLAKENAWDTLALEDKIKKCTDLPIKSLFKLLPPEKLAPLVKEMIASNQEAQVDVVIDKFVSALEEKRIHGETFLAYFKGVMDLFMEESPERLMPRFIKRLSLPCFENNQLLPVFIALTSPYLDKIIQIYMESDKFTMAKNIIQNYAKDTKNLKYFSGNVESTVSLLIDELMRMIEHNLDWSELMETLMLFKDQSARLLIERALFQEGVPEGKYFEAYLKRCTIGRVLNFLLDDDLINTVVKDKFVSSEAFVVKNLVEIIGAMGNEEVVKILKLPLEHPDPQIRRKVIFTLSKLKGEESAKLLEFAAHDKDEETSREALQALKSRKDDYARQLLQPYEKRDQ